MQVHYWAYFDAPPFADSRSLIDLVRAPQSPSPEYEKVDPQRAAALAKGRHGWVVVKIHEIDYHALLGDGWKDFAFKPTDAQRERCRTNHQGRSLEEVSAAEGFRWEELVAILTDQPWRRLVPMRTFTVARDWPLSVPQ